MDTLHDQCKPAPKVAKISKSKGPLIYVGRHGKIIGEYYLEGIQKGIACEYFVPKDRGWYEGLPEWLRIGEVVKLLTTPPTQRDSLIPAPSQDRAQRRATKVLTAKLAQKLRMELDSKEAR